jgi:hypothetical protein
MRRRRQRLEAGVAQPERRAGGDQALVDVHRLLGGDVQLVAELAEVGDAHAQHAREADVDLARGAERERGVDRSAEVTAASARASAAPGR